MSFVGIEKIMGDRYKQSGLSKKVTAALVCEEFDKLIEKKWEGRMGELAKTAYLKGDELYVACLSPVVASEFRLAEGEMIKGLNERFGMEVVKKLRFLT